VWGELFRTFQELDINSTKREHLAFDILEPSIEEGALASTYFKMFNTLDNMIKMWRTEADKKFRSSSYSDTSYVLTHNSVDDEIFNLIVMATIFVKRMATYDCFRNNGRPPNVVVYMDDGIRRTAENKIGNMRAPLTIMPKKDPSNNDSEDNRSILDHASKTSKKPMDDPVLVQVSADYWEIPKMLREQDVPESLFVSASVYYQSNSFDISPLAQAMIASFVGNRLGGSKPLNYLSLPTYQKLIILLQVYLIRNNMIDLAALLSSKTSTVMTDSNNVPMAMRMRAVDKSTEYRRCKTYFTGSLEKPIYTPGHKPRGKRSIVKTETINFINHIDKMIDWLINYNHGENMPAVLWDFAKADTHPIIGSECRYDDQTIKNLCEFYLAFHDRS
jgi:hypothetical protein